jgi:hypothetical protein
MYWNNPIVKITNLIQPSIDHQLFYCNNFPINQIQPQQTLSQLCKMANYRLEYYPKNEFIKDINCRDFVSNIVKINLMVNTIKEFGCVKPMLLQYRGSMPMIAGTGDSRLKAIECILEITTVPAIISTHQKYSQVFSHYTAIHSIDQLRYICNVNLNTDFYVRFTDEFADYGIDWVEYSVDTVTVPDIEWCLIAMQNYINEQSYTFRFTIDWFKNLVNWKLYS